MVRARVTKGFRSTARTIKVYVDLFNVFNTENLSFTLPAGAERHERGEFLHAAGITLRPGFGPPVGRPFTASFGARFEF